MSAFSYENQGTNTFLVYQINDDCIDTMSLGMLTNNKIVGIAPAIFTQMDTQKYIKYNVSSKIPVKQFFSGPVNKKRLIGVFNGIVDAMLATEDYMIDTNSIILDLEYIFADVSTCETILICLPICDTEAKTFDIGEFFKTIMFSTQFDQTENCDHVAKIINYLNSTPVFSLLDFKKILDQLQNVSTTSAAPTNTAKSTPVKTVVTQPSVNPVQEQQSQRPKTTQGSKTVLSPVSPKQSVTDRRETVSSPTVGDIDEGDKISMFYLLQHYNKENAEKYKAQKAAKKAQKANASGQPAQKSVPVQNKPQNQPNNPGFAIPGQPAPTHSSVSTQPSVNNGGIQNSPIGTPIQQQTAYQPPVQPQGQVGNFGETTVLGGGSIGETTVLNGGMQQTQTKTPHLIREKNNEKIILNKPVFRIGKEKSYVDYFIGDNTAVSRSHANIVTRENQYFIVDTNSTNHTFVNNKMIQSNNETEIHHGDKIRLGNEDFEFKLY